MIAGLHITFEYRMYILHSIFKDITDYKLKFLTLPIPGFYITDHQMLFCLIQTGILLIADFYIIECRILFTTCPMTTNFYIAHNSILVCQIQIDTYITNCRILHYWIYYTSSTSLTRFLFTKIKYNWISTVRTLLARF